MVNHIDEKTKKKVIGIVSDGGKGMSKKAQNKKDLRIWSNIQVPITFQDGLSRFTLDELHSIRKKLEIKNASSLKKSELVSLLMKEVPELLEEICLPLDQERYEIIKKIMDNGGCITAPTLKTYQINSLLSYGFIFTGTNEGTRILATPKEMIEKLKLLENSNHLDAIIKRNTEWIKLTNGLLHYYGSLKKNDLIELLEQYTSIKENLSEYLAVINEANEYYRSYNIDTDYFSNKRLVDAKSVLKEQQMRKDLNYFPFTKDQLLRAGETDFVEKNDSYLHLVSFILENYQITRLEAERIVKECIHATQIGENPIDILQFLGNGLEFYNNEMVQAIMALLTDLINNTKQWVLKGYSPKELAALENKTLEPLAIKKNNLIDIGSKKKIGRNDPCPCGSGKKYKKCCGK